MLSHPTQKANRPAVHGLNIVFTGNGKGKTTAAMGTLFRASGQGLSIGVIQFIKSPERIYGEASTARRLDIPFQTMGDGFIRRPSAQSDSRSEALAAWQEARQWICSQKYDLLILDEITYLFYFKWLDVTEFIAWVRENKPASMHLVMTGRYAPDELVDFADLVTEMREIKHPYNEQKIMAQPGVDY